MYVKNRLEQIARLVRAFCIFAAEFLLLGVN